MSGGQQDAARAAKAWEAVEDVKDTLRDLLKTDAYDAAFGLDPAIHHELNKLLAKYGLELKKIPRGEVL